MNYVVGALEDIKFRLDIIEKKYSTEEKENQATHLADNKLFRETLVYCKNNNKLLTNLVGEEQGDFQVEIESSFPINSIAEMSDMEEKLTDSINMKKLVI